MAFFNAYDLRHVKVALLPIGRAGGRTVGAGVVATIVE